MADLLDKLGINLTLLIAYFINFLILYFVLNKFVFKKAIANMEERKKLTERLVTDSEETKKVLTSAQKQYEEALQKAQTQAIEIIGKAEHNAQMVSDEIKTQANDQATKLILAAQEEMRRENISMRESLEKQIGVVVVQAVEKILDGLPESEKNTIKKNIDKKFLD